MTMPPKKNTTFNTAFAELESIAARFEEEDIDVESGLVDFERGLALAQQCRQQLAALEVRVKEIQEKFAV